MTTRHRHVDLRSSSLERMRRRSRVRRSRARHRIRALLHHGPIHDST